MTKMEVKPPPYPSSSWVAVPLGSQPLPHSNGDPLASPAWSGFITTGDIRIRGVLKSWKNPKLVFHFRVDDSDHTIL